MKFASPGSPPAAGSISENSRWKYTAFISAEAFRVRVTVSRSMKDTQFITRAEAATGIISRISRNPMTRFLSAGYVDSFRTLCPEKQEYTWWSYRFNSRAKNKGWRIDYCMVSEPVRPLLKRAYILNEAVHSDHCPMALEIL